MYRPGGMSSDEEDSDDYIYFTPSSNRTEKAPSTSSTDAAGANSSNVIGSSEVKNTENGAELNGGFPSLSEKAIFLSVESDHDKRPTSPRNQKSRRRLQLHEGVSLPLEELRMAAVHGNLPVIKSILSKGVAIDQPLKLDWTALMYASSCANVEVVKYLLQNGANPNFHKEQFTALMAASASSQDNEDDLLECVDALIEAKARVDSVERHRMTSLMFACKEGRTKLAKRLIDGNASIDELDNKGWTALCWAATKGHGRVVRLLLEHFANPAAVNVNGQKAADIAQAGGHEEIATILEKAASQQVLEEDLETLSEGTEPLLPKAEELFDVTDVDMFLGALGLDYLRGVFKKHQITMDMILKLTEKDFEFMEINALGTRKKLRRSIVQMNKENWRTTSLPNLAELSIITLPDAAAMIGNINNHLSFISSTLRFLRGEIDTKPRLLEIGQEKHSVTTLSKQCGASLRTLKLLNDEVYFFKANLDKVSGNVEFISADFVSCRKDDGRRRHRRLIASLVAVTTLATVFWFSKPKLFAKLFSLYSYPQKSVLLDL